MWSNIKTVVEEHLSSENVYTYIQLVNDLMMKYVSTDLPSTKIYKIQNTDVVFCRRKKTS